MTRIPARSSLPSTLVLLTVSTAAACQLPMAVGNGYGDGSGSAEGGSDAGGSGGATSASGDASTTEPSRGTASAGEDESTGGAGTTEASTTEASTTGTTEMGTTDAGVVGTTDAGETGTTDAGETGAGEEPPPSVCGDGIPEGTEQCDDGNLDGYDGCEPTCLRTIAEMGSGGDTICIRTVYGEVKCWGVASYTGNQQTGAPLRPLDVGFVELGGIVVDLSVGHTNACALLDNGDVRCWGFAGPGALGLAIGTSTYVGDDEPPTAYPPIDFGDLGGSSFVSLATTGENGYCGLLGDGGVRCWGDARSLGASLAFPVGIGVGGSVGDDETPAEAGLGNVPVGLPVVELMPLAYGFLARTSTGSFRAWGPANPVHARGNDTSGIGAYVGDPSTADVGDLPFAGIDLSNMDSRWNVACAVQGDGTVYCWGSNLVGGLGLPGIAEVGSAGAPTILEAGPVDVGGPVAFLEVRGSSTCAVLTDDTLRCWGYNYAGQLGRGHTQNIGDDEPPSVGSAFSLGGPVAELMGGGSYFCALLESGALKCWGSWSSRVYDDFEDLGDEPGEVGPALPAAQLF